MAMRIDKTGQHGLAVKIDLRDVIARHCFGVGFTAGKGYFAIAYQHGINVAWAVINHSENITTKIQGISCVIRTGRLQRCSWRCGGIASA